MQEKRRKEDDNHDFEIFKIEAIPFLRDVGHLITQVEETLEKENINSDSMRIISEMFSIYSPPTITKAVPGDIAQKTQKVVMKIQRTHYLLVSASNLLTTQSSEISEEVIKQSGFNFFRNTTLASCRNLKKRMRLLLDELEDNRQTDTKWTPGSEDSDAAEPSPPTP